jgi:hypothetical protein
VAYIPICNDICNDLDMLVHVDETETFTTVLLHGARYGGCGTAKRNPRDPYVEQVGIDIAAARAMRDLAAQVEAGAAVR